MQATTFLSNFRQNLENILYIYKEYNILTNTSYFLATDVKQSELHEEMVTYN